MIDGYFRRPARLWGIRSGMPEMQILWSGTVSFRPASRRSKLWFRVRCPWIATRVEASIAVPVPDGSGGQEAVSSLRCLAVSGVPLYLTCFCIGLFW